MQTTNSSRDECHPPHQPTYLCASYRKRPIYLTLPHLASWENNLNDRLPCATISAGGVYSRRGEARDVTKKNYTPTTATGGYKLNGLGFKNRETQVESTLSPPGCRCCPPCSPVVRSMRASLPSHCIIVGHLRLKRSEEATRVNLDAD